MLNAKHRPDYSEYTIKWAALDWEKREAYALRRRVFCDEQSLFDGNDIDQTDPSAQLLVALGGYGGWHEQLVGTVRIHEEAPGLWYGSRLAVESAYRSNGRIGTTLIKLAVSSAHALGCQRFLATVQAQNEELFRHLHWQRVGERSVCGRPHVLMEADLAFYPPCDHPFSGFVIRARQHPTNTDLAPQLLGMPVSANSVPSRHTAVLGG